jgi:hypothetical protein
VGAVFTVVGRDYARVLGLPQLSGVISAPPNWHPAPESGGDHRDVLAEGCGRERTRSDS